MNQVVTRKFPSQFRYLPLAGVLLFTLMLTACFGGGDETTPEAAVLETAVQQNATLTCTAACLAQGQCGTAADNRPVILAHGSQPTLRDHNVILENDSAVVIVGQQAHTILDATGATSTLNFFAVQTPGGGPTNWVAGTCVALSGQ